MEATKANRLVKNGGQVFTPEFLVREILDFAGYKHGGIGRKHVIDNSCGNGAFLCEVVRRYISDYVAANGSAAGVNEELELYIHGIEIEDEAYRECRLRLDEAAAEYGVVGVLWDVRHADALSVQDYNGRMDFVVGNPPYVRVHNLEGSYDAVKQFGFAQGGMTDIYLVFFELGFRMLNAQGRLCYITPSSWLSSLAASEMRSYIARHRTLSGLIDLGHFQAFEGATTYTMIALFDLSKKGECIVYYDYAAELSGKKFVDTLTVDDIYIDGSFYIADRASLGVLRSIRTKPSPTIVKVKNGFATLADKVFINDVCFDALTIPIIKASTGRWHRGFFPYDKKGKPLRKDEIFSNDEIARYMADRKEKLLKGKTEEQMPQWYLYGRTQALKDVWSNKIAVSTIVKDVESIKVNEVPAGSGLYSGLYVLTDIDFRIISGIIKSQGFIAYLRMLKNYKSGGYYTFNSKDLEQYINYKLSHDEQSYRKTTFLYSSTHQTRH